MKRRIIRFLFPKRRDRVRCQDCWLRGDCVTHLETGVIDYLPAECPNSPKAPLRADLHLPRHPF